VPADLGRLEALEVVVVEVLHKRLVLAGLGTYWRKMRSASSRLAAIHEAA
jgi:hypothetical protein